MSAAAHQKVFARFLDDPFFEKRLREAPEAVAASMGATPEYGRWLSTLDPKRVAAFRASQQVKARRRDG